MRLIASTLVFLSFSACLSAQNIDKIINETSVEQTERTLSSDDMRGRAVFTPDIERAADYIESRFKAAGLKTWNGSDSYRQPFTMVQATPVSAAGILDGEAVPAAHVIAMSSATELSIDENSGYEKVWIKAGHNFATEVMHYIHEKKNYLVLVDTSYAANFSRLSRFGRQQFKSPTNVICVLSSVNPTHYSIKVQQEIKESALANVVGILPGKKKKNEIVIFSGHYDHLGVTKQPIKGDSIYNGANDDASGTTAVIELADYFSKQKNNGRTLVFAAFTAEEVGEYGSQYFSSQFDPERVKAMFNIEMIGSESKWGGNSAFITGFERSDMGKILQRNLEGSKFTFYPDPYPEQQLFYRSDNASLARQGVPAHTISTTQIDKDKYYHQLTDELSTIDIPNMVRIIKAIALSSATIVDGTDTPSRVDKNQIR
ncbi:MAG TPA: M28 family peptidase [Puia sp.]|uniref:M28 family metallopeptidase n=1 Tax=Puia sp. TaxID=2045100 RepID=UPI002BE65CE6|nr:M28 family peptidase [Puia sp.]HVU97552.1 M28 family peptidase [Puia sp.]